jgi:O-antigen/teichoic acid export membrane protein
VGVFLGDNPLGLYSRAYSFATYPRSVLASPINEVVLGIYAHLKNDQKRLSQAFFAVNALLVRIGFFSAGVLILIAPEFIHLVIGDKWLPMLSTVRLMLVFTLLDPLRVAISHLFVAVGSPEKMVYARFLQLVVLVTGLSVLGLNWGIAGVAVAVDVMMLIGIAFMLWQAKAHVHFSVESLFAVPTLVLILGMVAASAAITFPGVSGSYWSTVSIKTSVFFAVYVILISLMEREQVSHLLHVWKRLQPAKLID